jgi:hypothetical protein
MRKRRAERDVGPVFHKVLRRGGPKRTSAIVMVRSGSSPATQRAVRTVRSAAAGPLASVRVSCRHAAHPDQEAQKEGSRRSRARPDAGAIVRVSEGVTEGDLETLGGAHRSRFTPTCHASHGPQRCGD